MYVTWEIVKVALTWFLAVCAGFSCICVAGGWLIKIIKSIRKPSKDTRAQVEDNDKRIKALEDSMAFTAKALSLMLENDIAILEHLRTNNSTGAMKKQEDKIHEFLTEVKL